MGGWGHALTPIGLVVSGVWHRHPGARRATPGEVSFEVEPGERVVLVGPNGAGKTTLLLRIVGLLSGPGEIVVGGMEVEKANLRWIRQRVGFLWQDPEDGLLFPTVREDIALGPRNAGRSWEAALGEADLWLDRLDLIALANERIDVLSMGQKQLVAAAGVLAREPGLLLLDEPTASLDQVARKRLRGAVEGSGATTVVVSHDPGQWDGYRAVALGDRNGV